MDRRFDLGRGLLLGGAVLVIISLFLNWYDTKLTGWEVFEALDLVLTALALAAMAVAVLPDAIDGWRIAAIPGAILFIVVVQLINAPPAAGGGDPDTGIWLALGAALIMSAGATLSLSRISVVVQLDERERRRRMAAVDRRADAAPTPPPADDEDPEPAPPASSVRPPADPLTSVPPPPAAADDLDRTQPLSAIEDDDEQDDDEPAPKSTRKP
jgi:hypothetical protein